MNKINQHVLKNLSGRGWKDSIFPWSGECLLQLLIYLLVVFHFKNGFKALVLLSRCCFVACFCFPGFLLPFCCLASFSILGDFRKCRLSGLSASFTQVKSATLTTKTKGTKVRAVLPQVSWQKSLDSQAKFTRSRSEQTYYIWNFCIEIRSFAWNDVSVYFIAQTPLHHLQVCKYWSCWSLENLNTTATIKSSRFSQEQKMTPLASI